MILIGNWRTVWYYYQYDELRNKVVGRKWNLKRETPPEYNGYGTFERLLTGRKEFFCFYNLDSDQYFQAGKSVWKIEPDKQRMIFKRLNKFIFSFEFYHGSELVYNCKYLFFGTALAEKFDSTYDGMDFDQDHLIYSLSRTLQEKATANTRANKSGGE